VWSLARRPSVALRSWSIRASWSIGAAVRHHTSHHSRHVRSCPTAAHIRHQTQRPSTSNPSEPTDRLELRTLAFALLASLLLWNLPFGGVLLYPFKLLATWLHELSTAWR
jgi:hypothetical protein